MAIASKAESTAKRRQPASKRLKALLTHEAAFIHNPEFAELQPEDVLTPPEGVSLHKEEGPTSSEGTEVQTRPLLSPAGERHLFRKLNYFRHRSNLLRAALDPDRPDRKALDQIEQCIAWANDARNEIAESNLRLVISIARRFAENQTEFQELVSEGNLVLLAAIDKFDYARGFRFSTYATYAVQRHFYRYWKRRRRRGQMEQAASDELLRGATARAEEPPPYDERLADRVVDQMDRVLNSREQFVVRERYGLGERRIRRTLRDLAAEMGLSKERVRQIETAALRKLEAAVSPFMGAGQSLAG